MAAAYSLGAPPDAALIDLVHTLLGTFLVAGGAAALNQVWERATDRLMRRTEQRPMADRRMSVAQGATFGVVLTAIGAAELAYFVNPLSAAVALLTTASYLLFYTPLKLRTSLSTIAGAVPGALPAVIGWAAATNTLSIEAWVLFGIVFTWQMPHFLAIAWMYRDEYARAGMPLLPVIEPDGRSTGRQAVLYTAVLIPISMLPTVRGPGHGVVPRRRDHPRRDPDGAEPRILGQANGPRPQAIVLRLDPVSADSVGAPRLRSPRTVKACRAGLSAVALAEAEALAKADAR